MFGVTLLFVCCHLHLPFCCNVVVLMLSPVEASGLQKLRTSGRTAANASSRRERRNVRERG